jgi:hypothetical protein
MQYIESSVIGIRSAVITLKHRVTPLRFVLFPMVHVAEPEFFAAVEARAGECDLIVAEGAPSGYAPVQEWMSKIRLDHLVDQMTAVVLRVLGRYGSPLGLPNLDQADDHDGRWKPRGAGRLGRLIEDQFLHGRDSALLAALGAIHQERQDEHGRVAVVYGAAHTVSGPRTQPQS